MDFTPLLNPFKIGKLELRNRTAMAPMTRSFSPGHVPGENVAAYYGRRAKGGVGLIITEGTEIDHPSASGYPDVPVMGGEAQLAGWKKVVDAVHAEGGKIFPQLWHVGSVRQCGERENAGVDNPDHHTACENPKVPGWGPSAIPHPYIENAETPHEMSEEEIGEIIAAFAKAAADAKGVGFDGLEIHGAHGYLIDQFFWKETNKRADAYGLERTRFGAEVIRAVREAVGPDFPIDLRISQWKMGDYDAKMLETPEELERFLTPLADAGVDMFHGSTRRFWEAEFEGSPLNFAGWIKKLTGVPVITVGSVGVEEDFITNLTSGDECCPSEESMGALLARLGGGEWDLVALGRALLADPEWLNKMQGGRGGEIRLFSPEVLKTLY